MVRRDGGKLPERLTFYEMHPAQSSQGLVQITALQCVALFWFPILRR